ncbi:oxidoreductase [Streptomyces albus]|uniref:Oxidoreductase n=1 Tax=Streptomyces albus (strain ATCC 21838 / DSM 41398 / FERM P-419 / JCM 4703 / NBRC 107858) TaxID=1081613 RepID=A0A0B5F4B3_STRA4|nr:oxidoreductase [Streptomyces albus]AOU79448.1 oxidoreductase [Streptomyces albus]AYN35174.1 FAD-binding oxidoreductase [Streptomyces albus]
MAPESAAPARPAASAPADWPVPVTGWGRTSASSARLVRPRSYEDAAEAVRGWALPGARGGIPRGLGRAHGDAAQSAGGAVLDMTALNRVHVIDVATGTLLTDAGVSLARLAEVLLPHGWFLPVSPGSGQVTVGGAIGADVHGLGHRTAGSFARHLLSLELLTADGEVRTVPRGTPLFDATTGGLGLTGAVLTATLRLLRVETSLLTVETERAPDLDDLLHRMSTSAPPRRYEAAWIDLLARGRSTGRAALLRADHLPARELPSRARRAAAALGPGQGPYPPRQLAPGPLGLRATGAWQGLRLRVLPRAGTRRLCELDAFFHPRDTPPHGPRHRGGLIRYECLLPYEAQRTLERLVRRLARRGCPAPLALLRRFGEGDPGWLSFAAPGWSLCLDLPARLPGLAAFLDRLDEEVAAAGGRVRLAEDARLRPDLLAAMYPRLTEFRELRRTLDPRGLFASDLSRRLDL